MFVSAVLTSMLFTTVSAQPPKKVDRFGKIVTAADVPAMWKSGKYHVTQDVVIDDVTFEKGAVVTVAPGAKLTFRKSPKVKGIGKLVKFQGETPDQVTWAGLEIAERTKVSLADFEIVGARKGVDVGRDAEAEIKGCKIHGCEQGIQVARNGDAWSQDKAGKRTKIEFPTLITNCVVADNLKEAVFIDFGAMALDQCSLVNNSTGLHIQMVSKVKMTSCDVSMNRVGVYSRWHDNDVSASENNLYDNQVTIRVASPKDFDFKGNFWGQGPVIKTESTDKAPGRVLMESASERPFKDAGSTIGKKVRKVASKP